MIIFSSTGQSYIKWVNRGCCVQIDIQVCQLVWIVLLAECLFLVVNIIVVLSQPHD